MRKIPVNVAVEIKVFYDIETKKYEAIICLEDEDVADSFEWFTLIQKAE